MYLLNNLVVKFWNLKCNVCTQVVRLCGCPETDCGSSFIQFCFKCLFFLNQRLLRCYSVLCQVYQVSYRCINYFNCLILQFCSVDFIPQKLMTRQFYSIYDQPSLISTPLLEKHLFAVHSLLFLKKHLFLYLFPPQKCTEVYIDRRSSESFQTDPYTGKINHNRLFIVVRLFCFWPWNVMLFD